MLRNRATGLPASALKPGAYGACRLLGKPYRPARRRTCHCAQRGHMMAAPALVYHDPFSFSPELVAFIPVLSPENSVEVTTSITGWRSLWDRHNKSILFFVY